MLSGDPGVGVTRSLKSPAKRTANYSQSWHCYYVRTVLFCGEIRTISRVFGASIFCDEIRTITHLIHRCKIQLIV